MKLVMKMLTLIKWITKLWHGFFKKEPASPAKYELVEQTLSDGSFVQGVRILLEPYTGIVVTVSPKVEIKEVDDGLHLAFDFNIVSNPNNAEANYELLRPVVGDIILDIIEKDYNAS